MSNVHIIICNMICILTFRLHSSQLFDPLTITYHSFIIRRMTLSCAVFRQPCSRFEIVMILLGLENGTHISRKKAEFFRCTAYRLDPISSGSFNDLDGEVVQPGRIQARVIPSKINYFA